MNPSPYEPTRRELRPDYARLANARFIKRNFLTDEISWEPTSIEAQLREAGLVQ